MLQNRNVNVLVTVCLLTFFRYSSAVSHVLPAVRFYQFVFSDMDEVRHLNMCVLSLFWLGLRTVCLVVVFSSVLLQFSNICHFNMRHTERRNVLCLCLCVVISRRFECMNFLIYGYVMVDVRAVQIVSFFLDFFYHHFEVFHCRKKSQ